MPDTVFSFDVFDTLLTRIVLSPKDVFLLITKQLHHIQPALPIRLIRAFWGARVWSEFSARRYSRDEDIGIADIYHNICGRYGLSREQYLQLISLEMKLEETVLKPIDGAAQLVSDARNRGNVAFISDMYLPAEFIRRILIKYDLIQHPDPLYVSGELGLSKGSGNLFRYVLSDLRLAQSQLIHCGDNVFSDRIIPRRLGIQLHPSCQISANQYTARIRYAIDLVQARYIMNRFRHA